MLKTVFLDRDGVINIDSKDYIKTPSEFNFIPKSPEAIALLNRHGFKVIVITNQSVIARKMASNETLEAIFDKMKQGVAQAGGKIDDIFFCPHHPHDSCNCRKPKPQMILDAAKKHGIDLKFSVMVGDSAKDIECAVNANCEKKLLVLTGNGEKAKKELSRKGINPDGCYSDLYEAANWIVKNFSTQTRHI